MDNKNKADNKINIKQSLANASPVPKPKITRPQNHYQCSICGKREPTNSWLQHWRNKHKDATPKTLLNRQFDDGCLIRGKPWSRLKHTAMEQNFDYTFVDANKKRQEYTKLEKSVIKTLIVA